MLLLLLLLLLLLFSQFYCAITIQPQTASKSFVVQYLYSIFLFLFLPRSSTDWYTLASFKNSAAGFFSYCRRQSCVSGSVQRSKSQTGKCFKDIGQLSQIPFLYFNQVFYKKF